ncbi:MAG: hypothetical protein ABJ382_11065, partial [Ilumatobacter sp.]
MKINRPRLLVGSLAVAVIVSVAGGYVWSQTVGGADASDVDAVLDDPQDRTIPDAVSEIPTNDAVEGEMLPE